MNKSFNKLLSLMVLALSATSLMACNDTPAEGSITDGSDPTTTESSGDSSVSQNEVVSIRVVAPRKQEYYVGDSLDLTGMRVYRIHNDGTERLLAPSDYTVGDVDMSSAGFKVVTVSFTHNGKTFTDDFNIYVSENSGSSSSSGSTSSGDTTYVPGGDTSSGEVTTDLDGFIAVAYAPEGVVLTDWTSEMKEIFDYYYLGVYPPFYFMEELRVTYDNLGILQVRGKDGDGVLANFLYDLDAAEGWAAIADLDNADRVHVYGRATVDNVLFSVDAMAANGYVTINYSYDVAAYNWPGDMLAELTYDEYESKIAVPQYSHPDVEGYIFDYDWMYNFNILCLGAPDTAPAEYAELLKANKWAVELQTDGDFAGMYFAKSRDARIILVFYHDGYGLMIEGTHGEGENYTTWEACIPAITDFGNVELGLERDIALEFPGLDVLTKVPAQYSIDRSINGRLQITGHRMNSYKTTDFEDYADAIAERTNPSFKADRRKQSEAIWFLPSDKAYAITIELMENLESEDGVTDIVLTISDYKIYEGYTLSYDWPTSQINTITSNLKQNYQKTIYVPSVDGATTYYTLSNRYDRILVEMHGGVSASTVTEYREALDYYSYKGFTNVENGFRATDMNGWADVTVTFADGVMTFLLEKHVNDTSTATEAEISFETKSYILSNDNYALVTWKNGPVTFSVEASNTVLVGNHDYINNPLRIYNGQTIRIATEGKTMTSIDFYLEDVTTAKQNFSKEALANASIEGLTRTSYNADTGVCKFSVDAAHGNLIEFVVSGYFALASIVVHYE